MRSSTELSLLLSGDDERLSLVSVALEEDVVEDEDEDDVMWSSLRRLRCLRWLKLKHVVKISELLHSFCFKSKKDTFVYNK